MIGIRLEDHNTFLETSPDTSIEIVLENPLLGDEDTLSPGSYSLPFTLPAGDDSPSNAAQLKNPDVIENNEAYRIQKAELRFDYVPFKSGNLKAKVSNKGKVNANFLFGLNSLSPDLKTARIRDLVSSNVIIGSAAFTKELYIKNTWAENAEEHAIKINGESYSDDSLSGLSVLINDYYNSNMVVDSGVYLPRASLELGSTPTGVITGGYMRLRMATTRTSEITGLPTLHDSQDPHIELHVTIEDEEDRPNWKVESVDLAPYYNQFRVFLDGFITGAHPNDVYRFPVMFNANLHEGEVKKEGEIINGVNMHGILVNDPNWGIQHSGPWIIKNFNSLQPFVLLKHVLDKIATRFAFEYEGDFWNEPDLATMLIDNSQTLDLPMSYIGDDKFIFWRRSFNVNEFVPDLTVVDFFKYLKGRYNIGVHVNEVTRKVRLQKRETVALSNAYEDVTSMASPEPPIEDMRLTGVSLLQPKEDSDAFSVEESFTIGVPEKTYEVKLGRLHRSKSQFVQGSIVHAPYVSRKNGEKFGFRIFHYKGIVDGGLYSYPAADISGQQINETLTDLFNNLYTRFWRYWLAFELNRRSVKVKVDYPFRLLRYYDFELKRRCDRMNYLVKSIRITLTNQKVSVSDLELYTMK